VFGCRFDDLIRVEGPDPDFGEESLLYIRGAKAKALYGCVAVKLFGDDGASMGYRELTKWWKEDADNESEMYKRHRDFEQALRDAVKNAYKRTDDQAGGMVIWEPSENEIPLTPDSWGHSPPEWVDAFIDWARGDIPGTQR
jgi:hypothetical protein